MKNIKQLSFVLFILSALAFSYPVAQVFAQGGGQCDSNPACNPASGTCCGQCDSNPACNPNDPNGIPCCSLGSNNMSSGTLPPRIPAPSGHDKMNHKNRKLSDKSDLPEGQELRDSFMGCQRELKNSIKQIQNLQDNAVQSSCGRGASQANVDQNTIRELRRENLDMREGYEEICRYWFRIHRFTLPPGQVSTEPNFFAHYSSVRERCTEYHRTIGLTWR